MCLYPRRIQNKKYLPTKKNERKMPTLEDFTGVYHDIPQYKDERTLYVNIPCGQCIECRENKAREWQVRLMEEIREHKHNYFVTLTFAPEQLEQLCRKTKQAESNYIAGYAVRRFLERWRKQYKTSMKHWLITELGHQGTERIHLHGLLMTDEELELKVIEQKKDGVMAEWKFWKYGNIFVGNYTNAKTINYMAKYVTKIDTDHLGFIGEIFCSPGIGKNWILRHENDETYTYKPKRTRSDYVLNNGARIALPKYYKNNLYNEEERELIWRDFMDAEKISILGEQYKHNNIRPGTMENITNKAKEINMLFGYGSNDKEYRKRVYNITERQIKSGKKKKFAEIIQKNLVD